MFLNICEYLFSFLFLYVVRIMIDYIFHRVFLVTVHDPICTEQGDLSIALYGSFLPIPPDNAFTLIDSSEYAKEKLPGSIIVKNERIVINKGRERVKLRVTNNGDRPVQVCIQLRTPRIKHTEFLTHSLSCLDWIALPLH